MVEVTRQIKCIGKPTISISYAINWLNILFILRVGFKIVVHVSPEVDPITDTMNQPL
jgi:hypothetical protein